MSTNNLSQNLAVLESSAKPNIVASLVAMANCLDIQEPLTQDDSTLEELTQYNHSAACWRSIPSYTKIQEPLTQYNSTLEEVTQYNHSAACWASTQSYSAQQ